MEYSEKQAEFREKILYLIKSYQEELPVYEVVKEMIDLATTVSLSCAPNELVGIKTVLACVEIGISSYEQTHS